jgi:hypothetical protein
MPDPARRTLGAVIGGSAGVVAYSFTLQNGIHLLAVVGAGLALGAGWLARRRSIAWGAIVAFSAVLLSILVEWLFRPFVVDPSFSYFIGHLPNLPPNSVISLFVVAGLGVYFGRGRNQKPGAAT